MKQLILEQSNEEFYTSHSGLALVGACINRYSELGRYVGRVAKGSDQIAEVDIVRSYLGLLCLGKSDYQAIPPCGKTFISSRLWTLAGCLRRNGCVSEWMRPMRA